MDVSRLSCMYPGFHACIQALTHVSRLSSIFPGSDACIHKRWRGRPCGVLVSAQHAVVLLLDPRHVACGHHLSTHIQIVMCQVPPRHVGHAGSQNDVIAGRGVACWPGTRPLQLLTVYCFNLFLLTPWLWLILILLLLPFWFRANVQYIQDLMHLSRLSSMYPGSHACI